MTDDPRDLATRVLDRLDGRADAIVHAAVSEHGLTRFANSRIHQHVGESTTAVTLRLQSDGRAVSGTTTRLTDDGLRALVDNALAQVAVAPPDPELPPLANPHDVPVRDHVSPATATATPDDRAAVVEAFVAAGPEFDAAGYCETQVTHAACASTSGHAVHGSASHAVLDGIHRDGVAAGMGHQGSRSLAELDGAAAGATSADIARRMADPLDLVPGALPVVLGPEATATIAVFLGFYGFNARAVAEGRSFARLGEQQFDPAFVLRDDITDPRSGGLGFDLEGMQVQQLDLVRGGIVQALCHDRRSAALAGTTSTGHHVQGSDTMGPLPTNLVVAPGESSVADLVAGIDRGLFVASFNYCRVLDPRTLAVTGLTRNGTFLIEDGVLTRPVANLRFTQSFVEALAPDRVVGVGADDRAADSEFGASLVTCPSLALASWNFTGGAAG